MTSTVARSNAPSSKIITVYAGSGSLVGDKYKEDAFLLGELIAKEGWIQLNGGGYTGLMGAATRGGLAAGGVVDCVILDKFVDTNMSEGFRNVEIASTMPDRKAGLSRKADAFIALPGGIGTLDEVAEVMCTRQLSFHEKPIVLVNTSGFYNGLRELIQTGVKNKLVSEAIFHLVCFADTPMEAIEHLKTYSPISIDKTALYSGEMEAASQKLN